MKDNNSKTKTNVMIPLTMQPCASYSLSILNTFAPPLFRLLLISSIFFHLRIFLAFQQQHLRVKSTNFFVPLSLFEFVHHF